ncbi:MAG: pirin family protein [Acidobacteria bacterium]|nr:pirin family protein [Acidobacteriota bacterium]
MSRVRKIVHIFHGTPTQDGAGVQLTRMIGTRQLPLLDPFLMLDVFRSDNAQDYIAGFPNHPHRGFETVTYMKAGRMRHKDHLGNEGLMEPGSAQWMTAGRGIIHSEMPEQLDGLMWGFQLWVNLPAALKMTAPQYQEMGPADIPDVVLNERLTARLVAGKLGQTNGPIHQPATQPLFVDLIASDSTDVQIDVPQSHQAFLVVYEGTFSIDGTSLQPTQLAQLGDGDRVVLTSHGKAGALLVAGKPIDEPIARYGPFVMNTEAELKQAFDDYRSGRF